MKKISNLEMEKIEGGLKCIYHFMALPLLSIFNAFGNIESVAECWNNSHPNG